MIIVLDLLTMGKPEWVFLHTNIDYECGLPPNCINCLLQPECTFMNGQLTLRIPFLGTNQLTNRSPSWQDGRSRQEIPRNLWKPKFLMCFCKDPSFASCLSHSKSVRTFHYVSSASILISSSHLHLCLPICVFPRFFIIRILYSLRSQDRMPLGLITLVIFGNAWN
jgi:hypothetical protein